MKFMFRRFETFCSIFPAAEFYAPTFRDILIHFPGVRNLCTDVSEHSVPFSRRLNFMHRRFGTFCSIFPAFEIYAPTFRDILFNFPGGEFYAPTFRNILFHFPGV